MKSRSKSRSKTEIDPDLPTVYLPPLWSQAIDPSAGAVDKPADRLKTLLIKIEVAWPFPNLGTYNDAYILAYASPG